MQGGVRIDIRKDVMDDRVSPAELEAQLVPPRPSSRYVQFQEAHPVKAEF